MGLFRKETHTHFERDEAGNVVETTHEEAPKRRIFERRPPLPEEEKPLTREEQFKPRVQPWKTERGQKVVKGFKSGAKRVDTAIVKYNRKSNILAGSKSHSYRPRRSSPIYNNYNPFGSTFDRGVTPMSRPKTQSKTKYKVIGGKAYPIAGTGKKKKSGKKKRNTGFGGMGGFDVMDNYGFFK